MPDADHRGVLIVEDDPDLAEALAMILESAGYVVRTAADGVQALRAIEAEMPVAIVLDMLMPVMDGWQLAHELDARYQPRPPIVVVTAAEDAGARAAEIGAEGYLKKPFDIDELRASVATACASRPPAPA